MASSFVIPDRFRLGRLRHQFNTCNLSINKRNRKLFEELKKEAKNKRISFSDLVFGYVRAGREDGPREIKKNPHIPSLDKYSKEGVGGKEVLDAAKHGLITSNEAADIIVSAKLIVAQTENTRKYNDIKSKRDTHKKKRIERFYSNVKESIDNLIPFRFKEDYTPPPPLTEVDMMLASGEWEEIERKDPPIYTIDYHLPYNPPK